MCGEKLGCGSTPALPAGSPPHVRGKAVGSANFDYTHRITPACAGKSHEFPDEEYASEDHPRMCGEKTKKIP